MKYRLFLLTIVCVFLVAACSPTISSGEEPVADVVVGAPEIEAEEEDTNTYLHPEKSHNVVLQEKYFLQLLFLIKLK